jgi:predicted nucleotidyltransferase
MVETEQIAEIVDRIVRQLDPEKIILFGSYARGDARDDSDVDLLVVAETELPLRDRFPAVRRLLADFPAAFDVFWKTPDEYRGWRDVVNHVVYFAEKYGTVVYERQDARRGATMVG